jgi:ABC-type glycerol-3-phosphate transport system permease component
LLFLVPFYAIAAVAFGGTDPLFNAPLPEWNPLHWQFGTMSEVISRATTGELRPVFVRTFLYVAAAMAIPRALVDQLPHADARVGEPAPGRRIRQ